jgi:hypothetical protein
VGPTAAIIRQIVLKVAHRSFAADRKQKLSAQRAELFGHQAEGETNLLRNPPADRGTTRQQQFENQRLNVVGQQARFFERLAHGGIFRPFSRIDPPARQTHLSRVMRQIVAADGQRHGGPVRSRIQQHERRGLTGSFRFQMGLPTLPDGLRCEPQLRVGSRQGRAQALAQERFERREIHQEIIGASA